MVEHRIATVAIIGGEQRVNRTLAALLRLAGYVPYVPEECSSTGEKNPLADVDLVILSPTLSEGFRKTLLASMRNEPETACVPILTLSKTPQEIEDDFGLASWSSRIEGLKKEVEEALQRPAAPDNQEALRIEDRPRSEPGG